MAKAVNSPERPRRAPRSGCPVACTLDVVGDRWSLLIVRDLLAGKSRYGDFLASAEGIPTNILAERLRRLEREGLIEGVPYSERPRPRVAALARWSTPWRRGARATSLARSARSGPTPPARPSELITCNPQVAGLVSGVTCKKQVITELTQELHCHVDPVACWPSHP